MRKTRFTAMLILLCCMLLFGCAVRIEGVSESLSPVEALSLPESVRIVALGEATHGNVEFQQLRLSVFRTLVEKYHVRAFALEGDFGGCAAVNDYIQGGEGTAAEAVASIGFQIYNTRQMIEFVEWMRTYNDAAAPDGRVRFYGFDMQRTKLSAQGLIGYYEKVGAAIDGRIPALFTGSTDAVAMASDRREALQSVIADLTDSREAYVAASSQAEYAYAVHYAECLLHGVALSTADNFEYSTIRDAYMADNVGWILETEALFSNARILLSGHNGHVAKRGSSYVNMGSLLDAAYADEYFVIGTDFYRTTCNIAGGNSRGNHRFCSKDPLAAQLRGTGENVRYLDFASVAAGTALDTILQSPMQMGGLGEAYAFYMHLLPQSYRSSAVPAELYDGMIFVYEATPIEVLQASLQ